MYKLISWYNQRRKKIWISIMIIAFIFIIIRLLNMWSKEQLEQEKKEIEENNKSNVTSYEKQSKSMVSGGKVDKNYQNEFGNLIDSFLSNCVNQEYEQAYELLSEDCKEELYPSLKIFIDQYCSEKFDQKKEYNFQSWTSEGNYIYLIKIYESRLASGNANPNYIQDYYTIQKELGEYKLNISGFVGKQKYRNKTTQKEDITVTLNSTSVYMDYQIYEITVKNNTEKTILLDPREKTDKTYTVNNRGVKIEALLYENKEEDLKIDAGEEKKVTIKFSNVYQSGATIKKIVFSNVVANYEEGQLEEEREIKEIEIEI